MDSQRQADDPAQRINGSHTADIRLAIRQAIRDSRAAQRRAEPEHPGADN